MLVRALTLEDIAAILALQTTCPQAPQWSEDVWREMLREAHVSNASRSLVGTVQNEALVAFIVTNQVLDVCEIELMAVDPAQRRRGLATQLIRRAIASATDAGCQRMQLEVRASNAAALGLYRSLGFMLDGTRRGYYADTGEDALLLSQALA